MSTETPLPEPYLDPQQPSAQPLSWRQIFFSLDGRMSRYDYWVRATVPMLLASLAIGLLLTMLFGDNSDTTNTLSGAVSLLLLYPSLCVYVKRWHDRNKSGWWMLIIFIPVIGFLWLVIELGFWRGTVGDNRYGPDPLER